MAKITHRYDLPDYAAFMSMGFELRLSDDVLKTVSDLAELVGAPTYIKTPVFPVREPGEFRSGPICAVGGGGYHVAGSSANSFKSRFGDVAAVAACGDIGSNGMNGFSGSGSSSNGGSGHSITRSNHTSGSRHHPQQIPNGEWDTILSFQKTEMKKKEGIELSIDNIRSALNKLTDKTYTLMFANIIKEIAALFSASNDDTSEEHNTVAVMDRVACSIFNTASSNAFYSEIYARLFNDLIEKEKEPGYEQYAIFRSVFEKNMESFMSLFDTIEYCDPKKNYDKFCDINKANEKRKAMSLFIVNLMKIGIVEKTHVLGLMRQIQELMYSNMRQEGKTNEVDELAENLFIMVKHSHMVFTGGHASDAETTEMFKSRVEQIIEVSKMKIKSKPSITNKTIFKHLDMMDEISGKAKK
jgi:L-rhamnose mutarotase